MNSSKKLDRLDLRILSRLQTHGRMTNVELAEAVGLSASPCLLRVKRLEKAGYIVNYGAELDLEKLGDVLIVFTEITLSNHRKSDFVRFETAVASIDEIMDCYLISGGYDYLLRFATRGVNHYQSIIDDLLDRNVGIEKYFSYMVIKTPFSKRNYPLEKLCTTAQA